MVNLLLDRPYLVGGPLDNVGRLPESPFQRLEVLLLVKLRLALRGGAPVPNRCGSMGLRVVLGC